MQTYSYTPKRQNKIPFFWFSFLTGMLVISVLICVLFRERQLIGQIGFVLFAVADIWVYSKYFFIHYTYTVTLMNGAPTLIVTQHRGKQITTVCQRELSCLSELHEFRRGGEKLPRELRVDARYSFLVSMAPEFWQTLYFIFDGECASVSLELDEHFISVIRDALSFMNRSLEGNLVAETIPETIATEETKTL